MMPLRWRARKPNNTAARRRVHPLRPAKECAAPDTAVLASTRYVFQVCVFDGRQHTAVG